MSIHDGHRDRMRRQLKTSGMDSLSDVQVLEVLLYYAAPRGDTKPDSARAFKPLRDARQRVFRAGIRAKKSKRRRRRRRAADPARAAGGAALPHEPQRAD